MLTKEWFLENKKDCHIKISTEEIFWKVVDKLIELGWEPYNNKKEDLFYTDYIYLPYYSDNSLHIHPRSLANGKQEIQISDILGEDWDVKAKFEVGKWYRSPEWADFYIKCDSFDGTSVNVKEVVEEQKHQYKVDRYVYKLDTYSEASLSEIQQYLPPNHPDLIIKPIEKWSVGSYVVALEDNCCSITKFNKGDIAIYKGEDSISLILDGSFWACRKYRDITKKDVKWFPTKEEAEAFSKELLEPKILTVDDLVEGEIYYGYWENNRCIFIPKGLGISAENELSEDEAWCTSPIVKIRKANNTESKQLRCSIKFNRFIPESELDLYDDETFELKSKNNVKKYVKCETQEQWDFVLSKLNGNLSLRDYEQAYQRYGKSVVINLNGNFYGNTENQSNYYTFQEWLDLNYYTFPKKEEFKVGDAIIVLNPNNTSGCKLNKNTLYFICEVPEGLDWVSCSNTLRGKRIEGGDICINGIRKATQSEIDAVKKSSEFVLPEKWAIKTNNDENGRIIGEWFDRQSGGSCYTNSCLGLYYHSHNYPEQNILKKGDLSRSFADDNVRNDYTEITFEQFQKYVLKETPKQESIETGKGILEQVESKELNMEELLEEAKRRYPVGCTFKSPFSGNINKVREGLFIDKAGNGIVDNSAESGNFVYYKGKWAEIISLPEEDEFLVECIYSIDSASFTKGKTYKAKNYKEDSERFILLSEKDCGGGKGNDYPYDGGFWKFKKVESNTKSEESKEFDRNWYVEVTSQEEADAVFDWLESQGEKIDKKTGYPSHIYPINIKYYMGHEDWGFAFDTTHLLKKKLSDILPNFKSKTNLSELDQWIEDNRDFSGTLKELENKINSSDIFISYDLWQQIPGVCGEEKAEYLWKVWGKEDSKFQSESAKVLFGVTESKTQNKEKLTLKKFNVSKI